MQDMRDKEDLMMAVHCNLSTLMGKRRYSIQDVHKLTGLSRSTVSVSYTHLTLPTILLV